MPVPSSMQDLATTASANYPTGSEPIGTSLDNYLRSHASIIRSTYALASSSIAAASTVDVGSADAEAVEITGSATINSLGTGYAGCKRELRFAGVCTLAASSNIVLPGGTSLTTIAGDTLVFRCVAAGQWRLASGTAGVRRSGDTMTGTLDVPLLTTGTGPGEKIRVGNDASFSDVNTAHTVAVVSQSFAGLGAIQYGDGPIIARQTATALGVNGAFQMNGSGKSIRWYDDNLDFACVEVGGGYGSNLDRNGWITNRNAGGFLSLAGRNSTVELIIGSAAGASTLSGTLSIGGGPVLSSDSGLRVQGNARVVNDLIHGTADLSTWVRVPRIFVGGSDPGALAADGDIWIP